METTKNFQEQLKIWRFLLKRRTINKFKINQLIFLSKNSRIAFLLSVLFWTGVWKFIDVVVPSSDYYVLQLSL